MYLESVAEMIEEHYSELLADPEKQSADDEDIYSDEEL